MSEENRIDRLEQLAALPLERIVVSACCATTDDSLGIVGGIDKKIAAATAQQTPPILAFGVADNQPGAPEGGLVVSAKTLEELTGKLCGVLPKVYGRIVDLPVGLDGAAGSDYDAGRFCPFPWLNQRVAAALRQGPSSGYLFLVGGPMRGKTSWALHWVRASRGLTASTPEGTHHAELPPLSAWFFARRYGIGGSINNPYLREENALQTLISMARLWRRVPPANGKPLLLEGVDERYDFTKDPHQDALGSAFLNALEELATTEPQPTKDQPLILLLDGGDELWGVGENTINYRRVFPKILPDTLPKHVFIVLLSRPGVHLLGQHRIKPVLDYEFTAADVGRAIDDYVEHQANLFDKTEGDALRHPDFKRQISQASEGAFGYVTHLMDELLKLDATKRLEQIERWRKEPGSLPFGVYEQRARELFAAGEVLKASSRDELLTERLHRLFVQALAALALLPEPLLTAAGLADLIAENASDKKPLEKQLLKLAGQFLVSLDAKSLAPSATPTAAQLPYLAFDHLLTYELALAYWELLDTPHALEGDGSEPPWRRIARHAQTLYLHRSEQALSTSAEPAPTVSATETPPVLTPRQRQAADARLHRRLGEGSARYWPQPDRRRPATQEMIKEWSDSQRYALLWGPWHAFNSGEGRAEYEVADPSPAVCRALDLLLDAGYLQTVVRVGGAASQDALRRSYIAADQAPGAPANQSLRQRIESAVLEWHEHLVNNSLQVGALLWNLLGRWEPAKDRATHWKASLDQPALITALPGVPTDLTRRLNGYNRQALSPCGQWLVTAGPAGATVWDLRQGAHRLCPVAQLLNWSTWSTGELCCAAADDTLYLLGAGGELLWVGFVDLRSGAATMARYAGHTDTVNSVALHVAASALIGVSGSVDGTVGVLRLSREDLADPPPDAAPQQGRLIRYAGHTDTVNSVALHVAASALIGVSGSVDGTVGVLRLSREDLADPPPDAAPQQGRLIRYAGHTGGVISVALHVAGAELIGLSGSEDHTVGVLRLSREDLADPPPDAAPQQGRLIRYAGHTSWVKSVALHVAGAELIGLSGSFDRTVGVLKLSEVDSAAQAQAQATSGQPDNHRLKKSPSAILYQWRLGDIAPDDKGDSVFWGLSDRAVVQATVTSAAENSPRFAIEKACPFHEPGFTPHDLVQLDEETMVVGGAAGNDIALLLLEWIRPI